MLEQPSKIPTLAEAGISKKLALSEVGKRERVLSASLEGTSLLVTSHFYSHFWYTCN